jgi:beta-glucosidase
VAKKRDKCQIYLNPAKPIEDRVKDLLEQMTLEEKIRQMGYVTSPHLIQKSQFSSTLAKKFFKGIDIGGIEDPRLGGKASAQFVNAVQHFIRDNTRLGIPALFCAETLHGHMSPGATIFPQAIGLGCSWNRKLVRQIASVIAREARATGTAQALSPNLDLARDPRWGRAEETYGEDPYLVGQMGLAYIRGLQGIHSNVDRDHLIATVKHFAAHGSPQGGVNLAPVSVGQRELRDTYLPPFETAIKEGRALSVMPAYSDFDGVTCSSSKFLLRKILREEWQFKGYTFSDYGSLEMLHTKHQTADSLAEAGRQAVEAGMDMEAPVMLCFGQRLLKLVQKGKVTLKLIDRSVTNILRVKFLAGLFENPFADAKKADQIINAPVHRQLARRAGQESIVLLKNKADLLPLPRNLSAIAVIGPNSDVAELGDYCIPKTTAVSPLQGILSAVSKKTQVYHATGCGLHELSKDGFCEVLEIAEKADVAVVCVGESSMSLGGVGWRTKGLETRPSLSGEGFDMTDLNLAGVQQELVEAVVATGTPTVVVLIHGRPLSINWIDEHVPAILDAWYPGEEGGNALADIIFGKVNPSGKLPISYPRSVGQIPNYYNHKPMARGYYKQPGKPGKPGRDYVFQDPSPLFEFGYGLSYTTFKTTNLRITPNKIGLNGKVEIHVDVQNTGNRSGKEVVQLYVNDLFSTTTTPIRSLRGFQKLNLKSREKKTVRFILNAQELSLINEDMHRVVEPGTFEVMIGGRKKRFIVKKEP